MWHWVERTGQWTGQWLMPRLAASQSDAATIPSLGPVKFRSLAKSSHFWDNCLVRQPLAVGERPVHWVGSSKRDFLAFPEGVKDDMGNALGVAQFGGTAPSAKPWKGLGAGVLELVESREGNAYRAVYTVRFEEAVYVLHAFQKKSPSGVRTARTDVALVARRLKAAQRDYEALYGKPKR